MIRYACPSCGESFQAEDAKAGRAQECHVCGHLFTVPFDSLWRRRLSELRKIQAKRHLTAAELDETTDLLLKTGKPDAAAKAKASADRQRERERHGQHVELGSAQAPLPGTDADLAERRAMVAMSMQTWEPAAQPYSPGLAMATGCLLAPLALLFGLLFLTDVDPRRRATGRVLTIVSVGTIIAGSLFRWMMISSLKSAHPLPPPEARDAAPQDPAPTPATPPNAPLVPATPNPTPPPQQLHTLEYAVVGFGPATVTYATPSGQQVSQPVTLPWASSVLYLDQPANLTLAVQTEEPTAPLTLHIEVDSHVWKAETHRGHATVGGRWTPPSGLPAGGQAGPTR